MKKYILALILALASLAAPAHAQDQDQFRNTFMKSTLALYQGKQVCGKKIETIETPFGPFQVEGWVCEFKTRFVCTVTVIDRPYQNEYVALGAGHCIEWDEEKNYYVADGVADQPVLRHVKIIKAEFDERYDYAVVQFHSFKEYEPIDVDTESTEQAIGTQVVNSNFAMGVGKEYLEGKVVSKALLPKALDGMKGRYLVSVGIGGGASGSAVVDAKTHKIIGLVEANFPGTQMSAVIIPVGSQFADFMDDDSAGLKPQPQPKKPVDPVKKPAEKKKHGWFK